MRIGINASFLRKQNTGIGQVTINFLKKLMEFRILNFEFRNNEEIEFVLYLEEDVDLELPDGFSKKVFLPPYRRDDLIRKIWWEKFSLPAKVKTDKCDALLSLYQCPTVLNGNIKHVMIVHDIIPILFPQYLNNWRKKLYQRLTEKAILKADKIIAVSHRTEKDLVQNLSIDPKKISVSYIDVDEIYKKENDFEQSQSVLKKYGINEGYIYYGGGLEVRKNTENLLKAYKLLLEEETASFKIPKLVISGKLMPQLYPLVADAEKIIEELDLIDQVILLGFVPQDDLPILYKNATFFIYPSLYEGFGLPVLEAMNQAVPVITSKTSSLPEVGSDSVLYCNPNDIEDMAMVMKNVLVNDPLRAALSLKGKERAGHFSWNKFIEKTINILKSLK